MRSISAWTSLRWLTPRRSGRSVILDYDANDNVVGVEILGLSKRVPAEVLHSLHFETR